MGYWAKDGSYVRDESDIKSAESMNETQGQYHNRVQAGIAYSEAYQKEQQRKQQAEREFAAQWQEENRKFERQQTEKINKATAKADQEQKEWENKERYGVPYNLRNPETLEDRRNRANFWRTNSKFKLILDKITKKDEKFHNLWQQYAMSKSEEERLKIVEQMEKMYPTKESAIRAAEKKAGFRK